MLKLNELHPVDGAVKKKKRVGRGNGSGLGKTAGRGHNGARSRSGYTQKPYFEGGQLPIIKRLPKRGFTSPFKKSYQVVNLTDIERVATATGLTEFTLESMVGCGLVKNEKKLVKILGEGTLSTSVTVLADAFSKSAQEKISKAGGKAEVVDRA
ncbi:50S ribosomal protein L15 [Chitinivibrio alkaliphilus]|uniref:Large ribosomal subunit protein uL15 n=1 Tax=Chitinivibrio alkaliphilus ACht1 TaxID=1313304 RepID=U7D8A2_9BACT|nr:50S ribosomal protein L15 [Chitinivibrio alkaliphilus]ERP31307.1 50S ribosomal protein L15 [Chitinivibrio alkaliphilus ACht1]